MPVNPNIFDWTCEQCGWYNKRESMSDEKVCVNCGHRPDMYDLEELDEDDIKGVY